MAVGAILLGRQYACPHWEQHGNGVTLLQTPLSAFLATFFMIVSHIKVTQSLLWFTSQESFVDFQLSCDMLECRSMNATCVVSPAVLAASINFSCYSTPDEKRAHAGP